MVRYSKDNKPSNDKVAEVMVCSTIIIIMHFAEH
ncbi:unnamed protein product [Camellia sinensis]